MGSRSAGAGEPLSADMRQQFESRLGFDFSGVRVHADAQAAESAKRLGALAYSVGSHVVVGRNQLSSSEPGRSWLIAHELAHVMQHAQGRGPDMVHLQPEAVPELDRRFREALEQRPTPDYQQAAEVLNRFTPEDIGKRLTNRDKAAGPVLSRGMIASLYAGALENPDVGKDANVANLTRPAYLDVNYENEMTHGNWAGAAEFLNGFNEHDILIRLERLRPQRDKLQALHDGAIANPQIGGPASPLAIVIEKFLYRLSVERSVPELQAKGELTLPVSTTAGGTPGHPAYISVGGGPAGQGTGVPEGDRELLSPATDWSKDPAYIDNNVAVTHYDSGVVNRFVVEYKDGTQIDLDYDSVRGAAAHEPPPPAPAAPASTTPAPAAGVTPPSPLPPTLPPPSAVPRPAPQPEARATPAFGTGGIFFRSKSNSRIYPTLLSKATIPTIYACAEQTAQQEPEARERLKGALISVAAAAQAAAGSIIKASAGAVRSPPGQPPGQRIRFYSLGARRKSGAQFLLRNVYESEVKASQEGYQVYEYYTRDGSCLYVGKSGGAGGEQPYTWVDRGWDHIKKHPEITEADRIRVTAGLNEQEAFALEEVRISELNPRINVKPGEYTGRFGAAGLGANAQSASQHPVYVFETDMPPPLKK